MDKEKGRKMTSLKLNETPIRTARNYKINNIKLENVNIPENISKFEGLNIKGISNKVNIKEEKFSLALRYGNGDILLKQNEENANKNLKIEIDEKLDEELILNFAFSKENRELVENILINSNENASGTLIIKFKSKEDEEYYHNGRLKVIAEKNSKLNIIIVNLLNNKVNNFFAIENVLKENAEVNYVTVEFGAKNNIINYYTNLEEKGADNKITTIYLGTENQIIDLNYIVEAFGEKTNVDIDLKGAINGNCKKHFKGTIDFKKGCKKAKGNENEYCTILSENAKSIALPMLLCTEEDVEGNHSTAAGKIDSKKLFYLMTRGLSKKDAQRLIVRAQFNSALEKIENEEVKNEIFAEIDKRI